MKIVITKKGLIDKRYLTKEYRTSKRFINRVNKEVSKVNNKAVKKAVAKFEFQKFESLQKSKKLLKEGSRELSKAKKLSKEITRDIQKQKPKIKVDLRKKDFQTKRPGNLKPEIKAGVLGVKEYKRGAFKGETSKLLLKGYKELFKEFNVTNKKLAKYFGVSEQTLKRIETGKPVRLSSIKKLSQGVNKFSDEKTQYILAQVMQHLKQYGKISEKKLEEIKNSYTENTEKLMRNINTDYYFLRVMYGRSFSETEASDNDETE